MSIFVRRNLGARGDQQPFWGFLTKPHYKRAPLWE